MPRTDPFLHENGNPSDQLIQLGKSIRNLFPNWVVNLHDEIDSTNSEARRQSLTLGGDAWPKVILTDFQTAGKGRQGKTWTSPAHSSLLVTIMNPISQWKVPRTFLPLAVSCWAMEGLERCGAKNVQVKWPNDILVSGQKVGGILCETAGHALAIGIGINLEQEKEALPERPLGTPEASSLRHELGPENYPGWITTAFTIMSSLMENIENPTDTNRYLKTYNQRCVTFDQTVAFKDPVLGMISGIAREIDETGVLIVEVPGHGLRKVSIALFDGEP